MGRGRRSIRSAGLGAAIALLAAAPAEGATAWQTESVSELADTGTLLPQPNGHPLVAWTTGQTVDGEQRFKLFLGSQEALAAEGYSWDVRVAADASGDIVALWSDGSRLRASERPFGGSFGPAVDVGPTGDFDLAVNPGGDMAVIARRYDFQADTSRIYGATRPAGGNFSEQHAISESMPDPSGADREDVAVTGNGHALFTWTQTDGLGHTAINVKVENPASALQPPAQTLTPLNAWATAPRVVADPHGEGAVVSWVERPDPDALAGPLYASTRRASGTFGARQPVGGSTDDWPGAEVAVAGGEAVLAWGEARPIQGAADLGPARATTIDLDTGAVAAPTDLSAGHVDPYDVALSVGEDGEAIVAFENLDDWQLHTVTRGIEGWSVEQNVFCPFPDVDLWSVAVGNGGGAILWKQWWPLRDIDGLALSTAESAAEASPQPCPRPDDELVVVTNPPRAGAPVFLDGSAGRDPDAVTADYHWDTTHDHDADLHTGSNPILEQLYDQPGTRFVGMWIDQTSRDGDSLTEWDEVLFDVQPALSDDTGEDGRTESESGGGDTGTDPIPAADDNRPNETEPPNSGDLTKPARILVAARMRMQRLLRRGLVVRIVPASTGPLEISLTLPARPTTQAARLPLVLAQRIVTGEVGVPIRLRLKPNRRGRRALKRRLQRRRQARIGVAAESVRGIAPTTRRVVTVAR